MKNVALALLLGFSITVCAKPVNVNTADAPTIAASLAGVGIKKAEAIVADREKNGAFKSAEDLKRVSGIGDKTVSANKDDILLEDPKPVAPASATAATPVAPAVSAPAKPPEVKK
jgi:competence protein ComEA